MTFFRRNAPATKALVFLEVAPRLAKLMMATASPFSIQRLNASVLPEPADDPVAALRALLSAQPLGARQVGLLIGRELFSLRTLELPSADPKEIASMLELQLGKLTPYPRADILSGWTTIGSFREGYTKVLLAVARKEPIAAVLQWLKTKGITPQWVGVSTEGLHSWWTHLAKPQGASAGAGQLSALIDVDGTATDCAILSENRLLFTHSITIGADQLAGEEQVKMRWMAELVRLPRILLHEDVKGQIGYGLLTGTTQGLQPLVEQLSAQWGVTVEVIDSLAPCAPSATLIQSASRSRVSYTALAGLMAMGATPKIDLIPQETRVSQALGLRSKQLARLVGSLSVIVLLVATLSLERIVILKRYLSQLHQRLSSYEQVALEVAQKGKAMRRVRAWLDPSNGLLEVFRALASAVDPEITVTQVSLESGKPIRVRGKAGTIAGAFAFANRLKEGNAFASVTAHPVLRQQRDADTGAEFEIVCELAGS
jgi:Tfp pilus assembly PilM family ATPase/Tfp pilus assembly protein PilN